MAANGKQGIKRKYSMLDEQFESAYVENWRKTSQYKVLGSEFEIIKSRNPLEEIPQAVEFEITSDDFWSLGLGTKFNIIGQFQYRTAAHGNDPAGAWTPIPATEADKVIVAPNWFDFLLKEIDIFHNNAKINVSNEGRFVFPFLNCWKYNYMHPDQKKKLCPMKEHPGNGVPSKVGNAGWSLTAESEWQKYAPYIFCAKSINFTYVPMDLPPLFQNTSYFEGEETQKVLPMPILGPLLIRFNFIDHQENIFKKKTGNTNEYKFVFTKFELEAEKLRLSKPYFNSLINKKGLFNYQGLTKVMKAESIPNSSTTFISTIQKTPFPEGMFIFAIPKSTLSGLNKYASNTTQNVFDLHNISKITFTYGDEVFFLKEPHIGQINNQIIESKIFSDYMYSPPFGMKMDPTKITLNEIKNGAVNTPYPCAFINLCNFGDKSRIVPILSDGSIMGKDLDLQIKFEFQEGGSTNDVAYIIYLYFTDVNLVLDTRTKGKPFFVSPYIKIH